MALLRYTLLRAGLFLAVAALMWLVGLRGFWLLLVALFVSGILSIFVLNGSRDAVSASLANRMSTVKDRLDDRVTAEDDWDDATRQDVTRQDAGRVDDAGQQGTGRDDAGTGSVDGTRGP